MSKFSQLFQAIAQCHRIGSPRYADVQNAQDDPEVLANRVAELVIRHLAATGASG